MCAARETISPSLGLNDASNFRFLFAGKCDKISGVDDLEEWKRIVQSIGSFKMLDVWPLVCSILAAILHLGELDFKEIPFDHEDGGMVKRDSEQVVTSFSHVCSLLGLEGEALEQGLCTRSYTASKVKRGSLSKRVLKIHECYASRDSIAKILYATLFDWLMGRINGSFKAQSDVSRLNLLDLPGFEFNQGNNNNNSLEQLTINYCNEKMQYFFLKVCCDQELALYTAEGLAISSISWENPYDQDQPGIMDLIEGKTGIFSLMVEESRLLNPSNAHLASSINYYNGKNAALSNVRKFYLKNDEAFVIDHFAGQVCYKISSFVEKNNASIHPDIMQMFANSANPLIREMFDPLHDVSAFSEDDSSGSNSKRSEASIVTSFKTQLGTLMDSLAKSKTLFIRCIKPNELKTPLKFADGLVLGQLRASGLLQAFQLMADGYPCRISLKDLEFMQVLIILLLIWALN